MQWAISPMRRERDGVLVARPRFVPADPINPDFNGPLDSDPWEEPPDSEEGGCENRNECQGIEAEFVAWDAASDEAMENTEDSLPE